MEFSNDGIRDSLTGLMAPERFYESAARLMSWARRRGDAISLISIVFSSTEPIEFITAARLIQSELRGGDLLARLGHQALVLMLVGDRDAAQYLIFRLQSRVKTEVKFDVIELIDEESISEALDRLLI